MARWAATVTVVAVRDEESRTVHATTATSFAPVAADPPLVVVALGPGAQVLPFLNVGGRVGVSVLAEGQKRWATVFADPFPVASPEWPDAGTPVLPGAVAALSCTVRSLEHTDGGATLVLCGVDEATLGEADRPLLYWNRTYVGVQET